MRRTALFVLFAGIAVLLVMVFSQLPIPAQGVGGKSELVAGRATKVLGVQLPVTHIILFSSGVGYFQREGEVEGDARIDLAFPVHDINDLLKSMVLQDLDGGQITTVSYDSHEPVERTLKSFALDLTSNPTFGQLLYQARGEKVEVVLQANVQPGLPGTLTGTIIGMETMVESVKDGNTVPMEMLNLLCADGIRSVKLSEVQRIRFLNPVLDGELRRALEVLAMSHDSQKKTVNISFTGEGKRRVRVGYVVENPIWKMSYRLVLKKDGKPFLQGWAVVENATDEDWSNVRMALVSGRPISFQMDLYQPLYIPRPVEEPELFASLRPPTYSGAISRAGHEGLGDQGQQRPGYPGRDGRASQFGGGFPGGGGMAGMGPINGLPPGAASPSPPGEAESKSADDKARRRLNFKEYQQRQQQLRQLATDNARKVAEEAVLNLQRGVASVATATEMGDFFQYNIHHAVNLPRQKSALLPIINKEVEGTKVSIYNQNIHIKFPLLGLKFKNTSGMQLMQGPITVFEDNSYAGDSRLLDLQPNEERLLSYAIDLGMEVEPVAQQAPQKLIAVKIVKGILHTTHKLRQTKTYNSKNRTEHDRILLIEHPFQPDWTLVTPEKPAERSREVYRFQLKVPAGKTAKQEVVEERQLVQQIALTNTDDQTIRVFLSSDVVSPKVKEALEKARELKGKLTATRRQIAELDQQLKEIHNDQTRLRANLKEMPPTTAAYKRYLEKFDKQETEIEKLTDEIKKLRQTEQQQRKDYEAYLLSLNVE